MVKRNSSDRLVIAKLLRERNDMKKLRVAIMGCGRISASYARAFQELSDMAELVCAVDKDEDRARRFAEPFGAPYGTEFEELLIHRADVVHLCLPHFLHAQMAVRAMRSGIHVLTEKPVAMTLQEADEMQRVSQESGRKLGVIFQTRYVADVIELRRMIREGRFGRIISARSILTWNRPYSYYEGSDWKGTWDREGGGVLIDQAIHSIDRIRFMLDSGVEWIEGSVHNHCHGRLSVEDTAEAVIGFQNGCLYSLYACNSYGDDVPVYLEFLGEKGKCGLRQDAGFYELDGVRHVLEGAKAKAEARADDSVHIPHYWGDSHARQIQDFYESVLQDKPVAVDAAEGRRTLEIVKGIYLSSLKKERIRLPFEDLRYSGLNQAEKGIWTG